MANDTNKLIIIIIIIVIIIPGSVRAGRLGSPHDENPEVPVGEDPAFLRVILVYYHIYCTNS